MKGEGLGKYKKRELQQSKMFNDKQLCCPVLQFPAVYCLAAWARVVSVTSLRRMTPPRSVWS